MTCVNGVDVSDYQGIVDWVAVKAAGYSFAVAKATEGTGNVQSTFIANMRGIRAAGMIPGAYHFFDWEIDPVAQASHFLNIYQWASGDLPPMVDAEGPCPLTRPLAIASVAKFLGIVEHAVGTRMLFYTGWSFANQMFYERPFSGHLLWVAAYNNDSNPPDTLGWDSVSFWQHSSSGRIDGISGPADLDRFIGSIDDLRQLTLSGKNCLI